MELPGDSRFGDWEWRYEQMIANKEGILRKLGRDGLLPEKKVSLEFQLQCIERGIQRHFARHPQPF